MAIQNTEPTETRFAHDAQFSKLLSRRADVDLTLAALEVARDHHPHLCFDSTLHWIDSRVEEMQREITGARSSVTALEFLANNLGGTHALRGDDRAFESDDSSFLNRVIETRRGIPISLSLLYIAVGSRLGLDLYAVASPAHFLVGCQTPEQTLFLDAFSGGRLLDRDRTIGWLSSLTGWRKPKLDRSLVPASPRHVIVRLLNNLKRLYWFQAAWHSAWLVQERLSALHPGLYDQQRDQAVLALKTRRAAIAFDLLNDCLKRAPEAERPDLEQYHRQARTQIAGWN